MNGSVAYAERCVIRQAADDHRNRSNRPAVRWQNFTMMGDPDSRRVAGEAGDIQPDSLFIGTVAAASPMAPLKLFPGVRQIARKR